jgi:hypothetical protein
LYDLLGATHSASSTDLRLAWKVQSLELETARPNRDLSRTIERAFNLLANPELRSCYDILLLDPDAPVLFPFGGFGSIAVAGALSADRETFFARRVLSFLPDYRTRGFRAHLRRVEFLNNRAVYRDSRRKAGFAGRTASTAIIGPDLEPMEAPCGRQIRCRRDVS